MKSLFILFIAMPLFVLVPLSVIAQPAPPPPGTYYVVERCYTVLFPYPHSKCEYVRVRRNYTPAPPPPNRLGPQPMGPRPGHHPSLSGGHGHRHSPGPGPRR